MKHLSLDLDRVALLFRRTKIIATIGPASQSPEMLERLIIAGVNVFRLNFSHGDHTTHGETFKNIREVSDRLGKHIAILADLCGPKIRVGRFEDGQIELQEDGMVTVTTRKIIGQSGLIPSEYEPLARDARIGDRILLDDGRLELRVEECRDDELGCRVIHGGVLKDRKGMNLPGGHISSPALTKKDREDARFAAKLGVDFMALSFVRKASDVTDLKALLDSLGADIPVIAKIEKPEAIDCIGAVMQEADGIMIARGDLGVEMEPQEVPLIQQELIRLAVRVNRPVIVATQMLESMCENPRPTRAEVTDVAWAAIAGADAVMLSGETAAGRYPEEAVATMDRTLRQVEGYQWRHGQFGKLVDHDRPPEEQVHGLGLTEEALGRAMAGLSRDLKVRAVVVPTQSGRTARIASGQRPGAPILAITHEARICRMLNLWWGITTRQVTLEQLKNPPLLARQMAPDLGLAESGEHVILMWNPAHGHDTKNKALTVSVLRV